MPKSKHSEIVYASDSDADDDIKNFNAKVQKIGLQQKEPSDEISDNSDSFTGSEADSDIEYENEKVKSCEKETSSTKNEENRKVTGTVVIIEL